jgi:uncharacterized membrane protein
VPFSLLVLAYWLHMAATVVWVGGLVFQSLILAPALDADSDLPERIRRRFEPLAWLSLAVLVGTGLMQMASNPNYTGLLAVDNRWSAAILVKHLSVGAMVVVAGYQTWGLAPALARIRWALSHNAGNLATLQTLQRRRRRLLHLQTAVSMLVLALTAVARSA